MPYSLVKLLSRKFKKICYLIIFYNFCKYHITEKGLEFPFNELKVCAYLNKIGRAILGKSWKW